MAIEFKTEINSLMTGRVGDLEDVVKQVQYTITASDEGYSLSVTQTADLPVPETFENFTGFEELTESQVLSWIDGTQQSNVVKEYLRDQLTRKIEENKLQSKRVPWAPVSPELTPPTVLPPAPPSELP